MWDPRARIPKPGRKNEERNERRVKRAEAVWVGEPGVAVLKLQSKDYSRKRTGKITAFFFFFFRLRVFPSWHRVCGDGGDAGGPAGGRERFCCPDQSDHLFKRCISTLDSALRTATLPDCVSNFNPHETVSRFR